MKKYERKIYKRPCKICSKLEIYTKEMCQSCYQKQRRSKPEEKIKLKIYSQSESAKAAQKKYRDKKRIENGIPKRISKEKKLCECGKHFVIAKGLCRNCYQKMYARKKFKYKPRPITTKEIDYNDIYLKILDLVKKGFPIYKALKKEKINKTNFYKNISERQKTKLRAYKTIYYISNKN